MPQRLCAHVPTGFLFSPHPNAYMQLHIGTNFGQAYDSEVHTLGQNLFHCVIVCIHFEILLYVLLCIFMFMNLQVL